MIEEKWTPDSRNINELIEFINFLKDSSIFYVRYLKRKNVEDDIERSWLTRISCHPANASITPLILAVFSKVTDQTDKNVLFELLEKLNFRYYGTGIAGRSDSGQGVLFQYANDFFNFFEKEKDGVRIDVQWLKKELANFVDQRANDWAFVESLTLDKDEAGDYYSWVGLKFFLASYEEHLRKQKGESINLEDVLAPENRETPNNFYHKEHIWAVKDYRRIKDEKNLDVNKRRLGNFLLLKPILNIEVSNNPPEDKVRQYFGNHENTPNTWMIRELKTFFEDAVTEEENSWKRKTKNYWLNVYKRFFDMREEKMVNFALTRWKVSGLNTNISKVKIDSLESKNEIWSKA